MEISERRERVVRQAAIESSRRGDGRFLEREPALAGLSVEIVASYREAGFDDLDETMKRYADGDR